MAILQASKQGMTTNVPMLAAAGAMLAPTRTGTFAESLGHAFTAAAPATDVQRQQEWQQNAAIGQLGVEGASVPLQVSQEDMQDFWKRMQLAEQAQQGAALVGGRSQVATIGAGSRENVAAQQAQAKIQAAIIQGNARVDWATINAQKGAWQYEGPDPTTVDKDGNPTRGVYLNKTWGTANFGPPVDPKSSPGARSSAHPRGQ